MYAIIYWKDDDNVFALQNDNGTLRLFSILAEADAEAEKIKESRVISIDGVAE